MTERDYGKELDELRAQVQGLLEAMPQKAEEELWDTKPVWAGEIAKMSKSRHRTTEDADLLRVLDRLEDRAGGQRSSGGVAYTGVFALAGEQSTWVREDIDTGCLLALLEDGTAGEVLRSLGSRERMALLGALLRGARTVAELVEECGFGSTGQVYHHLRPLTAADLVEEDGAARGRYRVKPHRVQGVIMLLCGVYDLVDKKYSGQGQSFA